MLLSGNFNSIIIQYLLNRPLQIADFFGGLTINLSVKSSKMLIIIFQRSKMSDT